MKTRPNAKMKFQSWMTTDEEERAKRRERAGVEPMKVKSIDVEDGFGVYEVSHPAADRRTAKYRVEIRSLDEPINTCDCPDFTKSGLGTCKHVERVLKSAVRKCGRLRRSPCAEVFMCRDPYEPRLVVPDNMPVEARRALFGYCDTAGMLRNCTAAGINAFVRMCDRLNEVKPGSVRVSEEVRSRLAGLVRRESLARAIADFLEAHGDDAQWPFLKKSLYPYQREGAYHLAGKGRALLADEMGLGKTVQAIAAALLLRETVGIKRALVVVPASLKGEWEDQIRFFSDADTELLYGLRHVRLARYADTKAFFLVANYEQVIRDWKEINDILKPDLVILDEAQRIKNWKTKTSRNLKGLSSPYAFVLTGTPLENRIDELYSLVEFVDPALFGSLFRFNRQFYSFDSEGHNEGMCNLEKLHEATSQILLRRRKAAVEDELPGRMTKTYKTGMTPEQERRYNAHLAEVASLVEMSKKRPLTPKEQDRLQRELSMMRMLCDTCYILDSKIKDSPKLDEFENVLDDIFADDPSRKVIVFSEWTRMLDLVIERLEKKGIGYALHTGQVNQKRRRDEIRRFKEDSDCRVFLASESGGVGLNLQIASVVVNLDMPWNPARLEQRIARAWRKNQKRDGLRAGRDGQGVRLRTPEHRAGEGQEEGERVHAASGVRHGRGGEGQRRGWAKRRIGNLTGGASPRGCRGGVSRSGATGTQVQTRCFRRERGRGRCSGSRDWAERDRAPDRRDARRGAAGLRSGANRPRNVEAVAATSRHGRDILLRRGRGGRRSARRSRRSCDGCGEAQGCGGEGGRRGGAAFEDGRTSRQRRVCRRGTERSGKGGGSRGGDFALCARRSSRRQ